MSDQSDVYVVTGSCGEYSDHQYWFVCALATEQEAKEFVEKANAWVDENTPVRPYVDEPKPAPFDPGIRWSYTSTDYSYVKLPVLLAEQINWGKET